MPRTVLFAEVPGFYAAVERADDPALASRPVIVGGDPRKRGRVQAATPEALAAGVTLEMTMIEALQRCPHARAVRTNMGRYREVSRSLLLALRRVHPPLEPFALGAAYAEIGGSPRSAEEVAHAMCAGVREALSLPLRVGIASGKFLARLAAEQVADEGVHRVPHGEEHAFLAPLDVTRLDGVGRKTAAALAELGALTIGDVVALGRDRLQAAFGSHGLRIHAYASGRDDEPVRAESHPQSLSRESTIRVENLDVAQLTEQLAGLAQQLEGELARQSLVAGRISLKVRYADGATTTRSQTLAVPGGSATELLHVASRLLERTQAGARPVRGLGIQLAGLSPAGEGDRQLGLPFP
jgi:DNA polymerase-4